MEYVIITGASKGLGSSLARTLADKDRVLVLIARDKVTLNEIKIELNKKYDQKVLVYPFDLNNYENIDRFINNMILRFNLKDEFKITFISNAGIIHPIKTVGLLEETEIKNNLTVNVLSPILIISKLIKFASQNNKQLKIINISSGAYNQAIDSWALYCTSKASMQMFLKVAASESSKDSTVKIVSIDPGVMDTGMQESIRNSKSEGFSKKTDFINLYKENKLRSVDSVSKVIKDNFVNNWNVNSDFVILDHFEESK